MTGDEREAMRICTRQGESRGLAASAGAAAVGYALFRRRQDEWRRSLPSSQLALPDSPLIRTVLGRFWR